MICIASILQTADQFYIRRGKE